MKINDLEKNVLTTMLLDLFSYANKKMLKGNIECIKNGVSERSICACLKSSFDSILPNTIFNNYYADVEYNRGSGKTLKAYESNNQVFQMTCDFILHSRGELQLDNLICLEMKKKSTNQRLMDKDRERLRSLTMPGGCETIGRNLVVRDYYLGIFYIIDYQLSQIELEYYSEGNLFQRKTLLFDEAMNYMPLFAFLPSRSITFFNMNFGDSFLIKDLNDSLLTDCGSINQRKSRKDYMVDLIYNKMNRLNNNLLITHYHSDHTSLILDLNNKGITFNNIYIRCLTINCFNFDFYSSFIELLIYTVRSHDYNTFLKWLNPKGLINLLSKTGRVHGVNCVKNNKIHFGGTTANVLWPSPTDAKLKEMEEVASEVESTLFVNGETSNEDDSISKIKQKINVAYRYYKSIYQHLINNENGVSQEELIAVLNNMDYEYIELSESDIQAFIKTVKVSSRLRKRLSDLENHLSIVFEIDSQLLMCGDADNTAMDGALLNYAKAQGYSEIKTDEFGIIKVPHHGTASCYYDFKNDNAIYLIPNSKLYRTTWCIDKKYVGGKIKCVSLNNGYKSACPNAKACCYKCPYVGVLDFYDFKF